MSKKDHSLAVRNEDCRISETMIALATARGSTKTICPSEVARAVWPGDWRQHMQEVREVAFVLRKNGRIQILQKGNAVSGDNVKGPLRIQIADGGFLTSEVKTAQKAVP